MYTLLLLYQEIYFASSSKQPKKGSSLKTTASNKQKLALSLQKKNHLIRSVEWHLYERCDIHKCLEESTLRLIQYNRQPQHTQAGLMETSYCFLL